MISLADLTAVAARFAQLGLTTRATRHPQGSAETVATHSLTLVAVACMVATARNQALQARVPEALFTDGPPIT